MSKEKTFNDLAKEFFDNCFVDRPYIEEDGEALPLTSFDLTTGHWVLIGMSSADKECLDRRGFKVDINYSGECYTLCDDGMTVAPVDPIALIENESNLRVITRIKNDFYYQN